MPKKARFEHEQIVYLFSDPEMPWIITGVLIGMGELEYRISNGYTKRFVFDCEITDEVIEVKKIKGFEKKD